MIVFILLIFKYLKVKELYIFLKVFEIMLKLEIFFTIKNLIFFELSELSGKLFNLSIDLSFFELWIINSSIFMHLSLEHILPLFP